MKTVPKPVWRLATTLAAAIALTACGGDGESTTPVQIPPDVETHIDSAGRLAIISAGSASVRVYDLDTKAVAQTFPLPNVPSAISASPDRRYALAFQRAEDLVSFVDGGLWQEDHVDHLHDYKADPKLLSFSLAGSRPTHYELHDEYAAVFMDGVDPLVNAEAVLLSDKGIGTGKVDARLALPIAMHGTAEPRGNYLLTTYRPAGAATTLPSQVELYRRNGATYEFVQRFAEACPDLHGSFSNEGHTAFGCSDGVLVVSQAGDTFTAKKIANPAGTPAGVRIATLTGHHGWAGFVGIASPGSLFTIEPVAGTISPINWATGRTRRAHSFDAEGKNFLVLDDLGSLYVLDPNAAFASRATLPAIASMPAAAPFPTIAVSASKDRAYVSDPVGNAIAVVNLETPAVSERLPLTFSPAGLAWLGISGHAHD
jgi:hypothetical protein